MITLKRKGARLLWRNGHLCRTCCEQTLCTINLDSSGGPEGFDHTYPAPEFTAAGGTLHVSFNAYTIKDRLVLTADVGVIYDSGCISGVVSPDVVVPVGTTHVRVQVLANCEGGIYTTAWTLSIHCTLPLSVPRPLSLSATQLSMDRFATCKACPDTVEGGFACTMYSGCCFGRRRGDPDFHCPSHKW